jgi:hypothetical protein
MEKSYKSTKSRSATNAQRSKSLTNSAIKRADPADEFYLVLWCLPMITHLDEVLCMVQAIQHCTNRAADHPMRFQRNLSWFEYVAQMAESMAAEWLVARTLGYDYSPGITWDKSKGRRGQQH